MKQRNARKSLIKRVRSPIRRGIIAAGVAMIVLPEPVTTAIGTVMVGACLAVPEHHATIKLAHCGASARRGNLNYGHGFA